jgi:threonine synthase
MHGARVIALRGNFDQALELVRELAKRRPIALVNSVNPFRLEGQKTASFEILDELGEIDALCIPVGNAGNVTAYWKGFQERGSRPRMLGYQAAGAAPLVHGAPVEAPETVASAIRIGNPARWEEALDAFTSSRGQVRAVTDAQILDAYRFLAREEGVFCEPGVGRRRGRAARPTAPRAPRGSPACSRATASRTRRPRSRTPAPWCRC